MKGRISIICKNMLESEKFPNDFFDEHSHKMIGRTYEFQTNRIIQNKYERTEICTNKNLTVKNKTKMVLFYPSEDFPCNIGKHMQLKRAVMLFGTKSNDGHAFAVCSDCLFILSLILLKYYMYGEFYQYKKDCKLQLKKAPNTSNCYLCQSDDSEYFRLSFDNRNIILCKKCLDDFTDLILTSPT
ncbi:MAG: hypothetical protein ACI4RF_03680, partial [Eubacterium sp.]